MPEALYRSADHLTGRMQRSGHTFAGVGGWLLTYWYGLSLLGPLMTTCTMASDDAWLAVWLLGVPAALVALPLLLFGMRGSPSLWRMSLPMAGVILLAVPQLLAELDYSTVREGHLCDLNVLPDTYGVSAPKWHRYYAPVQLLILAAIAAVAVRSWVQWRRGQRFQPVPV